jgi:bla regulator protein blaR1
MWSLAESSFLLALGGAVLNSIWQMAFCWVLYQVFLSFGIKSPALRGKIASLLLGIGFAAFLITFFASWFGLSSRSLPLLSSLKGGAVFDIQYSLQIILPVASSAYLILFIIPLLQFIRNYRFVQVLRANELSKSPVEYRMFVSKFGEVMNIGKPVQVFLSGMINSPVTIGFLKPIILLPVAAINSLSIKQVEAILLHELSHIRRNDYLINMLVKIIRTVLYFNPFVKLFTRCIEVEREKSCDELVIQFAYDRHSYASALLVLKQNNLGASSMAVAAAGYNNDLLHRIEKIMGIQKRPERDFRKLAGLLAGLVCIIGLNALFILGKTDSPESSFTMNHVSTPLYHLLSDIEGQYDQVADERDRGTMINPPEQKENDEVSNTKPFITNNITGITLNAPTSLVKIENVVPAAITKEVVPELDKHQEDQVKEALDATKKILEEGQWKTMEKSMADAMTQMEKAKAKQEYYSELKKLDWKKLENRIRFSFDNINWDQVNCQLESQVTSIRVDSLTKVYCVAMDGLRKAEKWMNENKVESIPDTDLKLEEIQAEKENVQEVLQRLRDVQHKKIVHL